MQKLATVATLGLDIAKNVFQVHGVDAEGQAVVRQQLKRRHALGFFRKLPACLVGIEACAPSLRSFASLLSMHSPSLMVRLLRNSECMCSPLSGLGLAFDGAAQMFCLVMT